jgi:hypothetical protein
MSLFSDALIVSAALAALAIAIGVYVLRSDTARARCEMISVIFGTDTIVCAMFAAGTSDAGGSFSAVLCMLALAGVYAILAWAFWTISTIDDNGSDLA